MLNRWFLLLCLVGGCAGSLDAAQQARGAISRAIDESTQAWISYDHGKQVALVNNAPTREEAIAALMEYRNGEQAKMIKALNGSWAALVGLDKAIALWQAGEKGGLAAALAVAYQSVSDVAKALTLLGIPITGAK